MAELGAQAAHGPNLHLLRLLLELVRTTPASVRKAAFAEPQQHAFCRTAAHALALAFDAAAAGIQVCAASAPAPVTRAELCLHDACLNLRSRSGATCMDSHA